MENQKVFKSSWVDVSFPWKVFFLSLGLWTITLTLWAWSAKKSFTAALQFYLFGALVSLCLSIFIQRLRVICTRPVFIITNQGLHIPGVVDLGVIPWRNIYRIQHFMAEIQKNQKQECLGIDVIGMTDILASATFRTKLFWYITQFLTLQIRQGHTYVIAEGQLAEGMKEVVEAIQSYKKIEFQTAFPE